ncbi:hypothetical protein AB0H88_41860 [Nonomuraea sp. NPDC050680]|uniref:hypothetical protein n=1 Tax=Nonomuraea sp. NPDC050680 TaxID=3154630 RepID=UPI0033FBACC2
MFARLSWLASVRRSRRVPAGVAIVLVVLGVVATAVSLDAASEGSIVRLDWSTWPLDGVVVDMPAAPSGPGLRTGDLVIAVAGRRLADGLGAVSPPGLGESVHSIGWGAFLAFVLAFTARQPLSPRTRKTIALAYAAPLTAMAAWSGVAALVAPDALRWLGLLHSAQTAVVALVLVAGTLWGAISYRGIPDPLMRGRMRWMLGGGAAAAVLGIAGWHGA